MDLLPSFSQLVKHKMKSRSFIFSSPFCDDIVLTLCASDRHRNPRSREEIKMKRREMKGRDQEKR